MFIFISDFQNWKLWLLDSIPETSKHKCWVFIWWFTNGQKSKRSHQELQWKVSLKACLARHEDQQVTLSAVDASPLHIACLQRDWEIGGLGWYRPWQKYLNPWRNWSLVCPQQEQTKYEYHLHYSPFNTLPSCNKLLSTSWRTRTFGGTMNGIMMTRT